MTDAPLDPTKLIDYEAAQLAKAQREAELAAAAGASSERVATAAGKVSINGESFTVVDEIVAVNMGKMQDAEESGSITQLIDAIALAVIKDERAKLLEILKDEDANVTVEKLAAFYKDAMEVIGARPTTK